MSAKRLGGPMAVGLVLGSFAAFGFFTVACHSNPPVERPRLIVVAPKAASPVPSDLPLPAKIGRVCAEIVPAIQADVSELARQSGVIVPKIPGVVGTCVDTPAGAWFVMMAKPKEGKPAEDEDDFRFRLDGAWEVHFETKAGVDTSVVVESTLANYGARLVHPPRTFDFDGDGAPELYLAVDESGEEGHEARQQGLFSFASGKVVPYPLTKGLQMADLVDADGDGRPDLLLYAGYTESLEGCFSGFPTEHARPKFMAHSLSNGTFSTDDAAAKAYVKSWCPAPPAKIVSSYDAICARLFAKDEVTMKKEKARVAASCVGNYCEREEGTKKQPPNASLDCERRASWFAKTPPFTLP